MGRPSETGIGALNIVNIIVLGPCERLTNSTLTNSTVWEVLLDCFFYLDIIMGFSDEGIMK